MSPVTTLQRKYLRGSLHPFIFLALFFLVVFLYFFLRVWDIARLSKQSYVEVSSDSSGQHLLETSRFSSSSASSPESSVVSNDARQRMFVEQRFFVRSGRQMHDVNAQAVESDASTSSEVVLLWRLFVVVVEAMHGLASMFSAAVACGASTYIATNIFR